jgi:hypothetical protein
MNAAISLAVQGLFLDLPTFDGRQLFQALDDLDFLAEKLNLETLGSFVYLTKEEIEDAGIDLMDLMMPQYEWFEAETLLEIVFKLRVQLESQPAEIPNTAKVLSALRSLELALEECETKHLAVRLTIET